MTPVKRTDDVLDGFKRLRERGIGAMLCLVGDGPDRPHLERRAHELGIIRDTLFLGYQEDVGPLYAAFDALVLPSGNEGTPVSVIEALAAGTPVVATRVGRDPELRERFGAAGRARVLPRYAVARLVDDIDRLYQALLEPLTR
jgi:glycosyltransferase involved in cell wall biosynthesis